MNLNRNQANEENQPLIWRFKRPILTSFKDYPTYSSSTSPLILLRRVFNWNIWIFQLILNTFPETHVLLLNKNHMLTFLFNLKLQSYKECLWFYFSLFFWTISTISETKKLSPSCLVAFSLFPLLLFYQVQVKWSTVFCRVECICIPLKLPETKAAF